MPGGGKSSISRCLGEGPEDFQQMILLYRDYIRYVKLRQSIVVSLPFVNLDLDRMGFTLKMK